LPRVAPTSCRRGSERIDIGDRETYRATETMLGQPTIADRSAHKARRHPKPSCGVVDGEQARGRVERGDPRLQPLDALDETLEQARRLAGAARLHGAPPIAARRSP